MTTGATGGQGEGRQVDRALSNVSVRFAVGGPEGPARLAAFTLRSWTSRMLAGPPRPRRSCWPGAEEYIGVSGRSAVKLGRPSDGECTSLWLGPAGRDGQGASGRWRPPDQGIGIRQRRRCSPLAIAHGGEVVGRIVQGDVAGGAGREGGSAGDGQGAALSQGPGGGHAQRAGDGGGAQDRVHWCRARITLLPVVIPTVRSCWRCSG